MDIIDLYTTKCTCLTKTPDTNYHKEDCSFRIVWERFYCEQEDLPPDMQKVLGDNLSGLYEE